ncbi:MAG: class I tRNA ligase family protein, partial [Candidatus Harrisonbacteria bacterium]|nr:class I tRNA ligase family protein [Candidatus Harrisonbacteria bacterium]
VALDPKLSYQKFEVRNSETGATEYLWSFNKPPEKEGFVVTMVEKKKGKELLGLGYEPPFKLSPAQKKKLEGQKLFEVRAADFINTEDGSGLVHIAPSFGEDDFKLMDIRQNLPQTITDEAKMGKGFPGEGKYVKEADKDIVKDLDERGLLYHLSKIKHEYPHCWRCDRPLFYVVRESWFIEMSKLRKELVKGNKKINWNPQNDKEGRFGTWLSEAKDWSISRNRYWGTPLPIWSNQDGSEIKVVGSLKELGDLALYKNDYYLMRHTQARHNLEKLIAAGPENSPAKTSELTKEGKEVAAELAKKLKKEKIDFIYASPYKRTKDTARIIAKELGLKVKIDKRLEELETGIFNWKTIPDFHAYFKTPLERFEKAPEGGETLSQLRQRIMDFYKEINGKHQDKRILIVSHGDPLWILEGAMRGLSNEELIQSDYYPAHEAWYKISSTNLPFNEKGELDPHRPYIDAIKIRGKTGELSRVEDVADVWFDSGAMPYASQHFPFAQNKGKLATGEKAEALIDKIPFPADYIAEAIDQTRGWFYTLHALANLLGKPLAFKNVVCLGLIHDKHGKKMSKSRGNIVDPWEMMTKYGADMVRWYMYTINDPGDPKNFNEEDLKKVMRKVSLILYNSFSFWNSYGKEQKNPAIKKLPANILDQWILAELSEVTDFVTKSFEAFKMNEGARKIEDFIDSLSRWYIRRSRSRFQDGARGKQNSDFKEASLTLQYVFLELSKLMAPFTPFLAEALYQSVGGEKESVHLELWPKLHKKLVQKGLIEKMKKIRTLAAAALSLRAAAQIKVRQPLASLSLKDDELKKDRELLSILADEVNVKEIKFDTKLSAEEGLSLDTKISAALREEGTVRELSRMIQGLRQDAGYQMEDRIEVYMKAPEKLMRILNKHSSLLCEAVSADKLIFKAAPSFDVELSTKLSDETITMYLKKI